MRKLALALMLALGACSNGQLTPQGQADVANACVVDQVVHPAVNAAVSAVPGAAAADDAAYAAGQAVCATVAK